MTMPHSTDAFPAADAVPDPDAVLQAAAGWHFRLRAAPRDQELQSSFENWMAQDPRHAEAWLLAQRGWSLAGETGAMNHAAAPAQTRRRTAAALALAACLALLLWPVATRYAADYSTATAQQREVALDDGSTLLLDADSAVDVRFDPVRRAVTLLRGEAYFEVASDAARPFTVRAGDLTVTVTGTAFSVGMTDRQTSVALVHGAVKLQRDGGSEDMALRPGERVQIERSSGAVQVGAIDPAIIAAWRNGRLAVQDVALGDVVAAIRRHHHGLILTPDEVLLGRKVTGVFDLQDASRALQALAGLYGARVEQYSSYLIVFSALPPTVQKN
jgi:transmembrane sensor